MIKFQNVSFGYSDGYPIFEGLTFLFSEGKTTAIMGPSGSGKTTLLKLACGLLTPSQGCVTVHQDRVALGSVRGLVFHEDTLLPWLTVTENAIFAFPKKEAPGDRARVLLTEFGLGDALSAYPHELSAGMRKRAEFARALLTDDRVLLLDEPFVSLDSNTRRQFWELWQRSDRVRSRTKIIVTHDMEEVRTIADEVIVLEAGRPVVVRNAIPVIAFDGKDVQALVGKCESEPSSMVNWQVGKT